MSKGTTDLQPFHDRTHVLVKQRDLFKQMEAGFAEEGNELALADIRLRLKGIRQELKKVRHLIYAMPARVKRKLEAEKAKEAEKATSENQT